MISGDTRTGSLSFPQLLAIFALLFFQTGQACAQEAAKETAAPASTASYNSKTHYRADNEIRESLDYYELTVLPVFERIDSKKRWNNVDASDALDEMNKFKGVGSSPVLRAIWGDILLADFNSMNRPNAKEDRALFVKRLELLNRLGFFDEAVRLYQLAAQKDVMPESVAIQGINALALSGSADGACLEVVMAAEVFKSDNWTQDAALCHAYFGSMKTADDYYARVKKDSGSGFTAVYTMLRKGREKLIHPSIPPLWRTILLARGGSITQQALSKADPATLASLAANAKVPLGVRLAAAARGANHGAVGPDRLRKLYEMRFATPESVSNEGTQAALYSQARFTFAGNPRAKIVNAGINQFKPHTHIKSHVYRWIVDKLTLQADQIRWFAPVGYDLMVSTNSKDSAAIYYKAGNLQNSTLSIIHAFDTYKPWAQADMVTWQKAMTKRFKAPQPRIQKALAVVRAADPQNILKMPPLAKNDPLMSGSADRQLAAKLSQARSRGGHGLSLLTVLNHLSLKPQISDLEPLDLSAIVGSLSTQGLFSETKKITLEILSQVVL